MPDRDAAILPAKAQPMSEPPPIQKPKLRGIVHLFATVVALPAAAVMVFHAAAGDPTTGAIIYCISLVTLLGISATYHTPTWSPAVRAIFRRFDHAAIFLLIAGTYTPLCLVGLRTDSADLLLTLVWAGSIAGIAMSLLWVRPPRVLHAGIYIALGWVAVFFAGMIIEELSVATLALIGAGGVFYTSGAAAYAKRWPDLVPNVFGYHELFHTFVVGAAVCHYAAVWTIVA